MWKLQEKCCNDCREPQAQRVLDKTRSNFCDFFSCKRGAQPVEDKAPALKINWNCYLKSLWVYCCCPNSLNIFSSSMVRSTSNAPTSSTLRGAWAARRVFSLMRIPFGQDLHID